MRFDVVVVLGMHRSGTSALTKGLELFGINLGSNVLGPGPDNAKGYFEDAELVQINDRILAKGCSHWSSIQFLEKQFPTGPALEAERVIARRWLQAKVANGKPVGLKDPRLCRTLPFWEPLFAEARLRVGYVLAIRAPMEIAASLQKRNGFDLPYWVSLWAAYMSDALRNLEGRAWTAAGFSQLLEDPRRELARLASFLGADWDPASPAVTAYEKEFLDPSLRHHRSAEAFPQEFSSYKTLASKLEFTCGDGKASKEEYLQAAQGVAQELEPISRALKTNNVLLFGEFFHHQVSLELFFALEPGAFTEERKISEKVSLASGARREISLKVTEAARKAPFWRIDPGFHAGKISLHDLKFLDASGRVLWDLAEQREKVFVGGTAAPLPLPNHGLELVSTGNDPLLILPPLPEGVQVASIRLVVEMAPVADGVEALARVQAAQQRTLHQQLESGQAQVAQLEGQLKVKKQEVQDLRSITGEVKKVRVETAKLGDSLAGVRQNLEAQKVATSKGVEELGDALAGLQKDLLAQKEAAAEGVKELGDSLAGIKQELIHELRGLVGGLNERQDQLQQRNLAEMDALRNSLEDRLGKNENHLMDLAKYAEQIQDSVIAPSSYMIPAPFSWYAYLYKILKVRKPSFIKKTPTANPSPPRLGFWRRLERSIRKRRKRWIAGIGFDRDWYLKKYPDVGKARLDPFYHFIEYGQKEGRYKNAKHQGIHDKLPKVHHIKNQGNLAPSNDAIKQKKIFDANFYLKIYPDVKESRIDPWDHYSRHGHHEGRLPHAINFSEKASEVSMSVIIPTYNGQEKISKTIEGISKFSHGMDIEIIIVNDGSSDQTENVIQEYSKKIKNIKLISTEQRGAGIARNRGAKAASKEILLFIGDDIFPVGPEFFNIHWALHKTNPQINYSVLGKVEWPEDPYFPITPVMRHIQGSGGEQFGYADMRANIFWDWRFFYTCNVSVKRGVVSDWEAEGFDPSFAGCGFEDGEFAYRMTKKYGSFNIFYSNQSVGFHYHRHTFLTFLQRQALCGSQLTNLIKLHPECAGKTGVEEVLKILNKNNSNNPELAYKTLESIRLINRFTLDLEAMGLLGNNKWHKELLHANFRLGYFLGFLNSSAKPHQGYAEALTYIFNNAVRPLVPHLPTSFLRP